MRKAKTSVNLGALLESFFNKRLVEQQNVSQNTVDSYRDTWKLFLNFLTNNQKLPVLKLSLEVVTAEAVLDFFAHLESERKCGSRTRNQRRAAIRSFAKHGILYEPQYLEQFQRILAIPSKRYESKVLDFLTRIEMDAILATPDLETSLGRRDYVLLTLMYNTGARISEILSVCCKDIVGSQILIHGKGDKERIMPLWPETTKLIRDFICSEKRESSQPLFLNERGNLLTRSGAAYVLETVVESASQTCGSLSAKKISPHTIRHTTAMHLLQSGTDINTIRLWLGHVHLNTTHCYIEADLDMKRKALENGGIMKPQGYSFKPTDEVKTFLDTLGVR